MSRIAHSVVAVLLLVVCGIAVGAPPSRPAAPAALDAVCRSVHRTAPGNDKFGFSGNSGDVFPGALWPRGMVQWSPDTPSNLPGGYHYPDTEIKGFSLTHFSGRGCTAYQDVPFMPIAGEMGVSPAAKPYPYSVKFSHANETAHPGSIRYSSTPASPSN